MEIILADRRPARDLLGSGQAGRLRHQGDAGDDDDRSGQVEQELSSTENLPGWASVAWRLVEEGASRGSISRATGIPVSTVHQRLRRFR
ncbi:hypothetical protein [Nonomuraea aurantiaca]|uniref:hypothetical protein n=1 Tax=Nonomuraea aurantiaca TaxID=2878562 RepID=UPI001CD91A73|nr:hypothetical protein [Nonomuraea aurantiaca]MCA2224881.1 hypothetical protein [Nonomuraea aurantiaca]